MPQVGFDPPAVKDDLCEHCHLFPPKPPQLDQVPQFVSSENFWSVSVQFQFQFQWFIILKYMIIQLRNIFHVIHSHFFLLFNYPKMMTIQLLDSSETIGSGTNEIQNQRKKGKQWTVRIKNCIRNFKNCLELVPVFRSGWKVVHFSCDRLGFKPVPKFSSNKIFFWEREAEHEKN